MVPYLSVVVTLNSLPRCLTKNTLKGHQHKLALDIVLMMARVLPNKAPSYKDLKQCQD